MAHVTDDAAHIANPTRGTVLNALARAVVRDLSFGDFVERDRDRFVGVDRVLVYEGLAGKILAAIGGRLLLHADPVVQLARALGDDVDEAELGIGMREQLFQVAENG